MSEREQSKSLRREQSRARMLVRTGLGMFPGIPIDIKNDGVIWQSMPAVGAPKSQRVQFNSAVLQEVERTIQVLEHQYARHIGRVIEAPGDWLPRIRQLLKLLKSKECYPSAQNLGDAKAKSRWLEQLLTRLPLSKRWRQQAVQLMQKQPELLELLSQLAFLEATRQRSDGALLDSVADWSEPLAQLAARTSSHPTAETSTLRTALPSPSLDPSSLPLPLQITLIARAMDSRWLKLLLELLLDPTLSSWPSKKPLEYAFRLAKQLKSLPAKNSTTGPDRPNEPSLGAMVEAHLRWLGAAPATTTRAITHILAELTDERLLANMQELVEFGRREEKRLSAELHVAKSLGPHCYVEQVGIAEYQARARVKKTFGKPEFMLTQLCELAPKLIEATAEKSALRLCVELVDHLRELKRDSRVALLEAWLQPGYDSGKAVDLVELMPMLRPALRNATVRSRWLYHWRHCYKPKQKHKSLDAIRLVYNYRVWTRRERGAAIGIMNRLMERADGNVPNDILYAVAQLLPRVHEDSALERYLFHCMQTDSSPPVAYTTFHLAFRLIEDPQRIDEAVKSIAKDDAYQNALQSIIEMKLDVPIQCLVRRLVSDDHKAYIIQLANTLGHFAAFACPLPQRWTIAGNTEWIKSYPETLQPALNALAEIAPEAEEIAERMLDVHFRRPEKVLQELTAIEATLLRLAQAGDTRSLESHRKLTIRHQNLQSRLKGDFELSSVRSERLQRQLLQRRDVEWVRRIEQAGLDIVRGNFREYGIEELPTRLSQSPYNRVLPGIAKLPEEHRQLAIRALATGWNSTLELTRESANERFLQQIARLGVQVQPWLDPELRLQGQCENGQPYTVAFTCDPFDIFLMGSHFDTCLSTHAINFYSTVANLVDVNKRVLYGRTADGRVIGRCLFALTNDGAIQTYYRYSHNREDGFQEMVSLFAYTLAERMCARLCDNGRVSCLVSRKWYDDGAVETADSFRSRLRRTVAALHECDSDQAYEVCVQHLGSHQQVRLALAELTDSMFHYRQALSKSWCAKFGQDPEVPLRVRLILAANSFATDAKDLAFTVLESVAIADVPRLVGRKTLFNLLCNEQMMHMIIAYDPRTARRWIRSSRLTGVQCDADETLEHRREALKRINELLRGQ